MGRKIYGVDISKKITPIDVRDAIIRCFLEAHSDVLGMIKEFYKFNSEREFNETKEIFAKAIVKKFFNEINADYDNPTKGDLEKLIEKLGEYAKNFRDEKTIKKHQAEIRELIRRIDE